MILTFRSDWIETISGVEFEFMNPTSDMIVLEDIAHALGMICRFTGQCSRFYSVAEHSIAVSRLVPKKDALAGLMHDASEAYLADIAKPVKPHLQNYHDIEEGIMLAVAQAFNFQYQLPQSVKQADLQMLSTEATYLMPGKGNNWTMWNYVKRPEEGVVPNCWPPEVAKAMFLHRFKEIIDESIN